MTNLLTDKVNRCVTFKQGGKVYEYSLDYRLYIKFYQTILSADENKMLEFLAEQGLPQDVSVVQFIAGLYKGELKSEYEPQDKEESNIGYNFDVLKDLIYAAFFDRGIELDTIEFLHFKKFNVLLSTVRDTALNDVISAYHMDTKGMTSKQKEDLQRLKDRYPLDKVESEEDKQILDDINAFFYGGGGG